jgi:hypothetical protein
LSKDSSLNRDVPTRPGLDDYTPWAGEVRKYLSGTVLVASDLMEF